MTTHSSTKKTKPASSAKPKLPQQKAKRAAAPATTQAKAKAAKPTPARSQSRAPRRPRPLVALAKRSDGRPLSFVERLSERRHAQFKHAGPVCHSCRISASQLAAASGPVGR